jgi:NAD(P)-dependent dehydrogenase (short-subunit alcohol dehydrogenase family)
MNPAGTLPASGAGLRASALNWREQAATSLRGQVAVVTGGASGIGRATCAALSRFGVHVVVVDIAQPRIDATVADLQGGGADALGLCLDVSDASHMDRLPGHVLDRFDRLDILVACAGIIRPAGTSPTPVASLPAGAWDRVIAVNLRGTFLSNRAVLGPMIRSRRGQIVNVSSVFGQQGKAFDNAYCASKAGIIGMTEALAEEVGRYGVRVHALLPDSVDTPIWAQNPIPRATAALPAERVGEFIAYLLGMPGDCVLVNPVIAPFSTRRRSTVGRRDRAQLEESGPR